jgi:cob(I)alamin adenosyltransferase
MADQNRFDEPQRVAINRVYTRKGDKGTTSLVGGQMVPKDDARIDSYGTVDELSAFVGLVRLTIEHDASLGDPGIRLARALRRIQHQLFNLGSVLATLPEDLHPMQPRIVQDDIDWLEAEMDRANASLEPLRSFVLAGGHTASVQFHACRTICRRAERITSGLSRATEVDELALIYLNRLSDTFFVWSRFINHLAGCPEELWQPNAASEPIP